MGDPEGQAASRKTYRYLRVGIVAMAVLLAVSVVIEIAFGSGEGILDSISAYYYTPVRGAFVGSLVAVGLGLVAIKGRDAEDVMLNLAGMLAPLVALVPTPISSTVAGFEVEQRTVPAVLVPYVENNVSALIVLGVVGLAFAWTTVAKRGSRQRRDLLGLTVGAVLLAGLAVWFGAGRASFLEYGHYAAAVPMFGLITAVAVVNARHAREAAVISRLGVATYRRAYAAIAWGMGAIIAVAGVLFVLETVDRSQFPSWLFWIEVGLLALFAAFWVFQTAEHWHEGPPEGADGPVSLPGPVV
jgi:hypothetical protein